MTENIEQPSVSENNRVESIYSAVYQDSNVGYQAASRRLAKFDDDIFEALGDEDFQAAIDGIVEDRAHLILENRVFKNFLLTNEPTLIAGLVQAHAAINEIEETMPLYPPGLERPVLESQITPKVLLFSNKGNRINLSQRIDLVARDVEVMQINLDAFNEEAKKIKFRLRAEIEESEIRLQEVTEARDSFEQQVVIDGVDPLTSRIPAEKFIWFMQDWHKSKGLMTEKLRLRNSALTTQYTKLKNLLAQKQELGESIHEVDFEQLLIENRHLIEKIEQKNTHLIELKKLTGKANLNLSTHKNYLHKLTIGMKTLKDAIEETNNEIGSHEKESCNAEHEVKEARVKYMKIKELTENYKVPSIMDYVRVKSTLYDLKKEIKILARKENILNIVLGSTLKLMKGIIGRKPSASWFQKIVGENDLDDDEDFSENQSIQDGKVHYEFDIFDALKK